MKAQENPVSASVAGVPLADDPRLRISALVDGEFDPATVERAIDALLASDDLAEFWADAHRAGDWMRSDEVIGVGDGELFLRRFAARLAAEPTILAPREKRSLSRRFWIRTGLPGASVAAAFVVVAWVATPFGRDTGSDRSVAATPTVVIVPAVASSAPAVEQTAQKPVDPERLTEYFNAHRDVTPFGYRGASARPAAYSAPAINGDAAPSQ